MKAVIIFASLLIAATTAGQMANLDSLKKELRTAIQDSNKVNVLDALASYYLDYKPDSTVYYYRQLIMLSRKLNDKFGEAVGFSQSALALNYSGNYPEGLKMALDGKKVAEELYKEGKPARLIYIHLVLGILDKSSGRYADAIDHFQKSISMSIADGSLRDNYGFYSQIGAAYLELGKSDSALLYAQKGYNLSLYSENKARLPLVYTVLANVYGKLGDYTTSHRFYHLAITESPKNNKFFQLARSYNDLATSFKRQGRHDSCIFYAQGSVHLSENYNYPLYAVNGYNLLAQMYELQNKPDSVLKYIKLMLAQKDNLFSQAKSVQYQVLLFNEEQRQHQVKETESAYRNKITTSVLVAVIIMSLLVATILYRNNLQKQKTNARLHQQQAKTERALKELKATQAQLIQSEKMASLGELTAGIAHEIQNPLNFVNNFSDVNKELLIELKGEADKGNIDEVKTIANDVIENEQKINHHGKRADAIVKGMLQHSRAGTGKKELTDINALAGEYLRLSYHGMRAKDKSFNAVIETEYDGSIGKVNIIPQDIGRVLLNLFNNAFYAVHEKKKQLDGSFEPTVEVSTKKDGSNIIISVKDNGTGMSQQVVNKIFQPFFTTKPTGEGTGLGLSLAYDIITKGYDGHITAATQEGEGSKFIIQLAEKE